MGNFSGIIGQGLLLHAIMTSHTLVIIAVAVIDNQQHFTSYCIWNSSQTRSISNVLPIVSTSY